IELTVLLTPLTFIILFLRTSRNSSMSEAETTVTMSNSPVTSYRSTTLSRRDRAWTTSSIYGDSTNMLTNAMSEAILTRLTSHPRRGGNLCISCEKASHSQLAQTSLARHSEDSQSNGHFQ